ncbi:hypothetical protein [Mycobacterium sp.]|uniref:hypothetical protein n=1 Tax=Mycobacterium sp. TaxID=1785 RepID=UPI003D143B38
MSTDTSTTDTATVEPDSTDTDETTASGSEAPEAPVDGAEDATEAVEDQDDDASDGAGREAAKYRRRLREAEAERDQLAERIEAMQRAEVERLATADSLRPAALWASGVELANLVADDGTVDGSKVSDAVAAAREQLGIAAPPVGPVVKREGLGVGRPPKPSGRDAMAGVIMGRDSDDR